MVQSKPTRVSFLLLAALPAAAACSSSPEMEPSGESVARSDATDPSTATLSFARRTVAANAAAESALHLVARGFTADEGNVLEFYEPAPGRIQISIASDPVHAAPLKPELLRGKSVLDIWQSVAPNEALPASLLAALQRGGRDERSILMPAGHEASAEGRAVTPAKAVGGEVASAAAPVETADTLVAGDTDYCASPQFVSDYAPWFDAVDSPWIGCAVGQGYACDSIYFGQAYQVFGNKYVTGTNGYQFSDTAALNEYLVCPGGKGGTLRVTYAPPAGGSAFSIVASFAVGHDQVRWFSTIFTETCALNLWACGFITDQCWYAEQSTEGAFLPTGTGGYWLLGRWANLDWYCGASVATIPTKVSTGVDTFGPTYNGD